MSLAEWLNGSPSNRSNELFQVTRQCILNVLLLSLIWNMMVTHPGTSAFDPSAVMRKCHCPTGKEYTGRPSSSVRCQSMQLTWDPVSTSAVTLYWSLLMMIMTGAIGHCSQNGTSHLSFSFQLTARGTKSAGSSMATSFAAHTVW